MTVAVALVVRNVALAWEIGGEVEALAVFVRAVAKSQHSKALCHWAMLTS
jgi:hypothetical protein